ncbi:type VI secretion system baseplate subunit TssG [Andreprevotia sp. IGB-42]|uniref:type VI secretion system baseplate subunit TssG n=1 Tax=Andreprevotia sp. IGB-42 TaxID=2497473 RepID=UPI00135C701A|nr:type VI secretion system baseplate subunit TssG [Andreprevotia sp. IGB-42]
MSGGAAGQPGAPQLDLLMRNHFMRFNAFQLVRLLNWQNAAPGAGKVRFHADWSPAFPGVEITTLQPDPTQGHTPERWRVSTPNYCVGGELGPLPDTFTEWLREQQRMGRPAGARFLDLFNHRFNVLRHEIKTAQDIALNRLPPAQSPQADYLAALAGLHSPHLQAQIPMPRRTWLALAGMLTIARYSSATLTRALQHYLGVPVRIEQWVGGWFRIENSEKQRLGKRNHALGHSALLGSRAWDDHAGIRIHVAELDYPRYCSLLPDSAQTDPDARTPFNGLAAMLNLLLDRRVDIHVRLQVRGDTCPPSRLSATAKRSDAYIGLRLGQTAWLAGARPDDPGSERETSYLLPAFAGELPA